MKQVGAARALIPPISKKVRANESYEFRSSSISLKLFGLGIIITIQQPAMLDAQMSERYNKVEFYNFRIGWMFDAVWTRDLFFNALTLNNRIFLKPWSMVIFTKGKASGASESYEFCSLWSVGCLRLFEVVTTIFDSRERQILWRICEMQSWLYTKKLYTK